KEFLPPMSPVKNPILHKKDQKTPKIIATPLYFAPQCFCFKNALHAPQPRAVRRNVRRIVRRATLTQFRTAYTAPSARRFGIF
ncbi:MAG: hypothetical protein ACI4SH_06370, partial [Candidatus Scatosoma sp.]